MKVLTENRLGRDMKKILSTRVGLMLLFTAVFGNCRAEAADFAKEYVVKAAISLNLARFTEWPDSALGANSQSINLCVLGNKTVQQAFAQMDKKTLGKRFLNVIHMTQPINLEQCNMIYVSDLDRISTIKLLSGIAGQPKLSIGEQDDFLEQGGMANLEMKEGKISIQVNLEAVTRSGIKISSRVLALTTIVNVIKTGNNQ